MNFQCCPEFLQDTYDNPKILDVTLNCTRDILALKKILSFFLQNLRQKAASHEYQPPQQFFSRRCCV